MAIVAYQGGCHCGNVRFEAALDLEQPVMSCNCSHCQLMGWLLTFIPAGQFTFLSGEGNLTEYRLNTKRLAHLFCSTCGVSAFSRGPGPDGALMYAVNARCLDGVDPDTLTIQKVDGRSR
ncbi:MAG TPA: GFA family protein [Candidatus Paceibacterota bacterium]|nr:GFA family protein [Candidatus Paceibacterota bacterium]